MLTGSTVFDGKVPDSMFKPHHLELFYYVAKYGGISAATRHIPYGIGQPAISGQMTAFERLLGKRLFERKPFKLTEQGQRLFAHVEPFFEGLGPLWRQLQGGPASVVSIAADEMIAQTLFPIILAAVAPRAPGAGLELRTAPPAGVETWLRDRGADLAITVSDRRVTGVRSLRLARLGLRLLVGRKTKIDSAGHFWRQGAIAERLIYPSEADVVHRNFERGLRGLGVEWRAAIRVNSAAVMRELVASGQGVGVDVELPVAAHQRGIRAIPLTGFEPVPLVLLWREPVQPGLEPVLAAVRATAGKLWPAGP